MVYAEVHELIEEVEVKSLCLPNCPEEIDAPVSRDDRELYGSQPEAVFPPPSLEFNLH